MTLLVIRGTTFGKEGRRRACYNICVFRARAVSDRLPEQADENISVKGRPRLSVSKLLARRVSTFLDEHKLAGPGGPLVVGVSGGPDSVCLLHLLARLRGRLPVTLHVAHLDHRLRGMESAGDAAYVTALCESLDLRLTLEAVEVETYRKKHRLSLEQAARHCRYSLFAAISKGTQAQAVLLGHTDDDQAETVLMHVLRGSGLAGIRGMEPLARWRGTDRRVMTLGRPLLGTSRRETEAYCAENGLEPRVDSSNRSREHLRNRVRLELLPHLRRFNPNVDRALLQLGASAGQAEEFLNAETAKHWKGLVRRSQGGLAIDRRRFLALAPALAVHLLRRALLKLRGDLQGIGAAHIQRMLGVASGPTGKVTRLPGGWTLSAGYDRLFLGPTAQIEASPPILEGELPLFVPGATLVHGWEVRAQVEAYNGASRHSSPRAVAAPLTAVMDGAFATRPLWVRSRRNGDRFRPLGMGSPKKLQDFMVDAKVPRGLRDRVPLLCDSDGILWVVGYRMDERARVGPQSKSVLRIGFRERA